MKNVTITLDDETAAWARVFAAEHNTSVSRIVGEMLQERMRGHREYEQAMRRYLSRRPAKLNRGGKHYPSRNQLHDRDRLR
jgi:plasmid stability protein